MQDDYLDEYGAPGVLGKNRASDHANKKITFASLYTQHALLELISHYFQLSKKALAPFGNDANDLLELTDYLQQRGNAVVTT